MSSFSADELLNAPAHSAYCRRLHIVCKSSCFGMAGVRNSLHDGQASRRFVVYFSKSSVEQLLSWIAMLCAVSFVAAIVVVH
jgi:hypothetical protein